MITLGLSNGIDKENTTAVQVEDAAANSAITGHKTKLNKCIFNSKWHEDF